LAPPPPPPLFPYTTLFRSRHGDALEPFRRADHDPLRPLAAVSGLLPPLPHRLRRRDDARARRLLPLSRRAAVDGRARGLSAAPRSEEHTSELQSLAYLVCR